MEDMFAKVWGIVTALWLRFIVATIILVVGWWVAKAVRGVIEKVMKQRDLDPIIVSFTGHLAYVALCAFVILAALARLGIQTTSFVAVVGAAGLAIALAFQGSLANFAAGFLIVLFRPFKVGDFIDGAGAAGTVDKMHIFTTQLKTPDNKVVIIPNAKLTSDKITNFSAEKTRRVDLVFGVGYGDDLDKAKNVIKEILENDARILKDPPFTIGVVELGDNSVNIAVRPWVASTDYWNVCFYLNETIKKRFDAEGITIPFPQRDIHLYERKE
ncbi:MAG: mechanosensitive ion channel [Deltaproteobacteria bacterium]|nr:mechanosensitive ion channel [Deltaproteobacteria bacterium]